MESLVCVLDEGALTEAHKTAREIVSATRPEIRFRLRPAAAEEPRSTNEPLAQKLENVLFLVAEWLDVSSLARLASASSEMRRRTRAAIGAWRARLCELCGHNQVDVSACIDALPEYYAAKKRARNAALASAFPARKRGLAASVRRSNAFTASCGANECTYVAVSERGHSVALETLRSNGHRCPRRARRRK